jgi:hypothetical protein
MYGKGLELDANDLDQVCEGPSRILSAQKAKGEDEQLARST